MIQGLGSFVFWGFGIEACADDCREQQFCYTDRFADAYVSDRSAYELDHFGSEHTDSQPGVPAYTLTLIADE